MKALVLAIVLFTCQGSKPQVRIDHVVDAAMSGIVKGSVFSTSGAAAGVTVTMKVNGVELAAITDENGDFIIKQALPVGRYKIDLFYLSQTITREIDVLPDRATVLHVTGIKDGGGEI